MRHKKPAPRPILLDMDPGVDDALAILLALRSPEVDVEVVFAVDGAGFKKRFLERVT